METRTEPHSFPAELGSGADVSSMNIRSQLTHGLGESNSREIADFESWVSAMSSAASRIVRAGSATLWSSKPSGHGHLPKPDTLWGSPQGNVELMAEKGSRLQAGVVA
jgi:hypothetical protein